MSTSVHLIQYLPIDILKVIEPFLCNIKPHHTPNHLARIGSLYGLQYLHKYQPSSFTWEKQKPILLASQYGHLHIVQWLYTHGYRDNSAMTYACINGYSDIVMWLHMNGCPITQSSIIASISYNHYILGKYLLSRYDSELDLESCLRAVVKGGMIQAYDWFDACPQVSGTVDYNDLITLAIKHGRYQMTRRLHQRYSAVPRVHTVDYAIRRGALDVVQYCIEEGIDEPSQYAISDAIVNGHSPIVQYLNPVTVDRWAFNIACMKGHLKLIKWVYRNYPYCVSIRETLTLMTTKMYSNPDSEVIRWLKSVA
jgi:hypothetical protein